MSILRSPTTLVCLATLYMPNSPSPAFTASAPWRYGLAVVFVTAALVLTSLLQNAFSRPFWFLFFAAVTASAWVGGNRAGWLAVVLSTLAVEHFFSLQHAAWHQENIFLIVAFIASAAFISWLSSGRSQMEASLRKARDELEARVENRTAELKNLSDQLRALAARLQTVREEERTTVAREIHDELGQALTAIKIDLTAVLRELPTDEGPIVQRSQSTLILLDEAIESVRKIATELRPGILDDLGLVAAVEWAAEEFQARTGTKCEVSLPDADIAMDPECTTALFRIFQETLTNVARHAKATKVSARLSKESGNVFLEVQDNGRGIDEKHLSAARSLGIMGMRERALLLGGDFTVRGAPGKGTTVEVRIPNADGEQTEVRK